MQSTDGSFSEHSSELEALYVKEGRYGMVRWFIRAISNYANFDGRARRKEFWWFYLGFIILSIIAVMADDVVTYRTGELSSWTRIAVNLFFTIPLLSVTTRRLHDIGWSGLWQFLIFGPLLLTVLTMILSVSVGNGDFFEKTVVFFLGTSAVGLVIILILTLFKTSPKTNKWGAPAKRA